jgi:predicted transcriptional regulator
LDAISNKTQNAENKISGVTDQLYSLDELTKKDIQNNPYSAEVWQRTKNYIQENGRPERSNEVSKALITDVADRVQEKLMAKMKEGGESGRLYKPLLEA